MNESTLQEILFYARCQLEGMLAENAERARRGQAVAYVETDFLKLAEETRQLFREAANH